MAAVIIFTLLEIFCIANFPFSVENLRWKQPVQRVVHKLVVKNTRNWPETRKRGTRKSQLSPFVLIKVILFRQSILIY